MPHTLPAWTADFKPVGRRRQSPNRYNGPLERRCARATSCSSRGSPIAQASAPVFQHAPAAGAFLALALLWTWPLPLHLGTHLPGAGFRDNVNFLWNFWWMREALGSHERFFFTPYLFVPFGTDLTLHTHTALNALVGATALQPFAALTALNVTILASLFLNGFCAYLLAWRLTGDAAASTIAGIVFGGSPYLAAHLNGHFNLTSAWTLPLFALACTEALQVRPAPQPAGSRPATWRSTRSAALAGAILGATAYIDYYYVVYQIAFAVAVLALSARDWSIVVRGPTARTRRAARVFAALALVDVLVIIAVRTTGGFDTTIAGVRVVARDVFNPLQALWVLLAAAALLRWRPLLAQRAVEGWRPRAGVSALATMAGVGAAIAMPIVWNGAAVMLRGEYVSQQYFWRNAPKGIDAATLVLGNPFHGAWGGAVRSVYNRLEIDAVESGGWLGVVPLILAGWAIRRHWADRAVRQWTIVAGIFFVWALGPHLRLFGATTGMILPQTLVRYVPIAANARIPGRAIVLVFLAMAVLGAIAVARRRTSPGRSLAAAALAALVIVDYAPAPFPIVEVDRPAIYETLRDRLEPGALLELPVGIRDSFVGRGFLDHRVLAYQMIHRRPIVGGVVSRLSPTVVAAYQAYPLVDALLNLSEQRPLEVPPPDRRQAADALEAHQVGFVMLNREHAPGALIEYAEQTLPLTVVAVEGPRTLYRVGGNGVR